jgi:hypothetical protein
LRQCIGGYDVRGKWIALSIPRRIVTDLMYFSAGLPWIVAQRDMVLSEAQTARAAHPERPTWTALFVKAFAIVAGEFPELRRVYMRLPWPHLYEYETSAASVVVERDFGGEPGVMFVRIKEPDTMPVAQIGRLIRDGKTDGYANDPHVRLLLRIAALPLLLRRLTWWVALNLPRVRGNYLGTFGLSTVAALGTEILQPRSPLTTILTYGVIDDSGNVTVRAVFDHRVLDAMTMAKALGRLEDALNGPIAEELRTDAAPVAHSRMESSSARLASANLRGP